MRMSKSAGAESPSTSEAEYRVGTMQYLHTYTDANGDSAIEDATLAEAPAARGTASESFVTPGVTFRTVPAGTHMELHPAPRRQFVVTLSGMGEIVTSTGERRRIGPGGVLLAEDTTGKGHLTSAVGSEDWHYVIIPLG